MSKRVVTFGEIMLRLAPNSYYRFFQSDQMQATFGGGEANVAVSLANYGMDAQFFTVLPANLVPSPLQFLNSQRLKKLSLKSQLEKSQD